MTTKQSIWKAVSMTLTACHPRSFTNLVPPKLLARWIIRNGVPETIKALKDLSHDYRKWAVTGEKPSTYVSGVPITFQSWLRGHVCHGETRAQVARLGRLLPKPPQEVMDRSIEEWYERVTVPDDGDYRLADEIYRFGAQFATENYHLLSRDVSWEPNETASLSHPRSLGGRMAEAFEDARAVLNPDGSGRFGAAYVWGRDPIRVSPNVDRLLIETAVELMDVSSPIIRPVAVPEYGYKSRVVTLMNNRFLTPGDLIRSQVWPMLENQPWLDADKHPDLDKFKQLLRSAKDRYGVWVSADLSTATDYIPFLYSRALWHGIFSVIDSPAWCGRYVDKMFGPMEIEGRELPMLRGSLMGTPLSFMTLCLLHRFAIHRCGFDDRPVLIRGDDLIGFFPHSVPYIREMERLHFVINKRKTFITPNGGTFAERTFRSFTKSITTRREAELWSPRRIPKGGRVVTGVRSFFDIPLRGILHAGEGAVQRSKIVLLGETYNQIKGDFPQRSRKLIARLIGFGRFEMIHSAMVARLPLHTPLELGGPGIPDPRAFRQSKPNGFVVPHWLRQRIGFALGGQDTGADGQLSVGRRSALKIQAIRMRAAGDSRGSEGDFIRILEEEFPGERSHFVWTYEPFASASFRAWHRRRRFFDPFESEQRTPLSFRSWARMLRRLPANRHRWSARASAEVLIARLKFAAASYVPIHPTVRGPLSTATVRNK